jgi:hypothetical protein
MHAVFTPKSDKSDNIDNPKPALGKDFTSLVDPKYYKRRSTLLLSAPIENNNSEESDSNKRPNVFASDENEREIIYNDLLETLMIFITNVKNIDGGWRHHLLLIKNTEETLQLFYMPEIHNQLVPIILEFLMTGNTHVRTESCKILAKVIKLQHHIPYREELIMFIK